MARLRIYNTDFLNRNQNQYTVAVAVFDPRITVTYRCCLVVAKLFSLNNVTNIAHHCFVSSVADPYRIRAFFLLIRIICL
jgi:hypothetical protein